jgi:hypothetical protein
MAVPNKKEKAVKGIKHQGLQMALMATTSRLYYIKNYKNRVNFSPGFVLYFNNRKLFRMTKIVLPS